MATIVPSELAPDEAVHYSLGGVEFDLGGKNSTPYTTDERDLLANAESHPWLSVQYDAEDSVEPAFREPSVLPQDDILSAQGPHANDAFDPALIEAAEAAKWNGAVEPVAIDAGLDQSEPVVVDGVAETLAAANTTTTDETADSTDPEASTTDSSSTTTTSDAPEGDS